MKFYRNYGLNDMVASYIDSYNVMADTSYITGNNFHNLYEKFLDKAFSLDLNRKSKDYKKCIKFLRLQFKNENKVKKLAVKGWNLKEKYSMYLDIVEEIVNSSEDNEEIEEENEVNVAEETEATETESKPEEDGDKAVDSGEKKETKEEDKPEDLGDKPKDTGVKKDKVAKGTEATETKDNVANETVATEKKNIEALFK